MPRQPKTEPVPENWELLFPGRFLRGIDIEGKRPTVEIARIWQEVVRNAKCTIIQLKGKDREWKLNFTNAYCLVQMFGKNPRKWVGHKVTLCAEIQTSFGETKPAVRVAGSPELTEPIKVEKELGDGKWLNRTLTPTTNGRKDA